MKIHEYQAKELFLKYQLPVPQGKVAFTVDEAVKVAPSVSANRPMGRQSADPCGRQRQRRRRQGCQDPGRGPHVLAEDSGDDSGHSSDRPRRKRGEAPPHRVRCEYRVGVVSRDYPRPEHRPARHHGQPRRRNGHRGGRGKVSRRKSSRSGSILRWASGISSAGSLAAKMQFGGNVAKQFADVLRKLTRFFVDYDCSIAEINPLITTKEGSIVALDAKINFDDNALYRHPTLAELGIRTRKIPLRFRRRNTI